MIFSEEKLEEYIDMFSKNENIIDELPDEIVDSLIEYLDKKIKEQEKILRNLEDTQSD